MVIVRVVLVLCVLGVGSSLSMDYRVPGAPARQKSASVVQTWSDLKRNEAFNAAQIFKKRMDETCARPQSKLLRTVSASLNPAVACSKMESLVPSSLLLQQFRNALNGNVAASYDLCSQLVEAINMEYPEELGFGLYYAALHGYTELVKLFIKHGTSAKFALEGYTALHAASYGNHADIIAILINTYGATHVCADDGLYPLHWAVKRGNLEAVQQLMAVGAPVDLPSRARFEPIAISKQEYIVEVYESFTGETALECARRLNREITDASEKDEDFLNQTPHQEQEVFSNRIFCVMVNNDIRKNMTDLSLEDTH